MSDVLERIFAKPSGVPVDGLVTGRRDAGSWLVEDRLGRTLVASSAESWRPGVDWVTVQDGRIIARAMRRDKIQEYRV